MGRKSWLIPALLIATISLMGITPVKAEILTFMKIDCHPDTKSLTIATFYDSREIGRKLLEYPETDIYYVRDLSVKDQNIDCNISSDQKFSIRVFEPDFMLSKSFFALKLNGHTFSHGTYSLGNGALNLLIQETEAGKYLAKLCPGEPGRFFNHSEGINNIKSPCQLSHVVDGKNQSTEFVESE